MAHANWSLLKRLLKKLDFVDSNIYLHIDAKAEISREQLEDIKEVCNFAVFHMVPRKKVMCVGGYSQIDCELSLLKEAIRDNNDYFHFMSGNDYLLVSEEEFKAFFYKNQGKEFIGFSRDGFAEQERQRYQVYHFLQEKVGRNKTGIYWIEKVLVKLQMKCMIDRTKRFRSMKYEIGSNWCSLTNEFVEYLLSKENMIKRMFNYTYCCDESFVQTIFVNSSFNNNNYKGVLGNSIENIQNVRAIDWKRGKPYTYEHSDYKELIESKNIFVRKVNNDTPEREKLLDLLDKRKD